MDKINKVESKIVELNKTKFSIVPEGISLNEEGYYKNYKGLSESLDINLLSKTFITKSKWFESFSMIYFTKFIDKFVEYTCGDLYFEDEVEENTTPNYSSLSFFNEEVYNKMLFNLWFAILYNPHIIPSSYKKITDRDEQIMSDLIDEQLSALFIFQDLTIKIEHGKFNRYVDTETIKRKLKFLTNLDPKNTKENKKFQAILDRYIFEVILNKYNYKSLMEDITHFFNEFEEFLPQYIEFLTIKKETHLEDGKIYKIYSRDEGDFDKLYKKFHAYAVNTNRAFKKEWEEN